MEKTKFTRDETNARLTIERRFPATPDRVWHALTEPDLLDRWWAPKPWRNETLRMDFRVDGHWLYAMHGPKGECHHGRMDYLEIDTGRYYKAEDVFCDADGIAMESLPRQVFENRLTAEGRSTLLVTIVQYASAEDMNRIFEMGFKEGLSMAYAQLEALLSA